MFHLRVRPTFTHGFWTWSGVRFIIRSTVLMLIPRWVATCCFVNQPTLSTAVSAGDEGAGLAYSIAFLN